MSTAVLLQKSQSKEPFKRKVWHILTFPFLRMQSSNFPIQAIRNFPSPLKFFSQRGFIWILRSNKSIYHERRTNGWITDDQLRFQCLKLSYGKISINGAKKSVHCCESPIMVIVLTFFGNTKFRWASSSTSTISVVDDHHHDHQWRVTKWGSNALIHSDPQSSSLIYFLHCILRLLHTFLLSCLLSLNYHTYWKSHYKILNLEEFTKRIKVNRYCNRNCDMLLIV